MRPLLIAIALAMTLPVSAANAACGSRSGVRFGETLGSIATRCGINVQRLRDANPGLTSRTLQNGVVINTPPPQLPSSPPAFRGNRSISGAQATPYDYHFGLPSPRPNRKTAQDEEEKQQRR
jgi:LysM repeat protein